MIANNDQNKQLPNELTSTFKELQVLKRLRKAGITKSFGFSCAYPESSQLFDLSKALSNLF